MNHFYSVISGCVLNIYKLNKVLLNKIDKTSINVTDREDRKLSLSFLATKGLKHGCCLSPALCKYILIKLLVTQADAVMR